MLLIRFGLLPRPVLPDFDTCLTRISAFLLSSGDHRHEDPFPAISRHSNCSLIARSCSANPQINRPRTSKRAWPGPNGRHAIFFTLRGGGLDRESGSCPAFHGPLMLGGGIVFIVCIISNYYKYQWKLIASLITFINISDNKLLIDTITAALGRWWYRVKSIEAVWAFNCLHL